MIEYLITNKITPGPVFFNTPEEGLPDLFLESESAIFIKGTHTLTIPKDVFKISLFGVGAGGSGSNGNIGDGGGGGGYGGSSFLIYNLSVNPGDVLTINVGAGGRGLVGKQSTSAPPKIRAKTGGNSIISLNGVNLARAAGGIGGESYYISSIIPPVASSLYLSGKTYTRSITFLGGIGGTGYNGGGGGGGAASFKSNGGNGSTSQHTTASGVYQPGSIGGQYSGSGGQAALGPYISNAGGNGGKGQRDITGGGGGGSNLLSSLIKFRNGQDGNGLRAAGSKGGDGGWPGGGGGGSYDNNTGLTSMGANGVVRIVWGSLINIFEV